jgi:hypothetical protein
VCESLVCARTSKENRTEQMKKVGMIKSNGLEMDGAESIEMNDDCCVCVRNVSVCLPVCTRIDLNAHTTVPLPISPRLICPVVVDSIVRRRLSTKFALVCSSGRMEMKKYEICFWIIKLKIVFCLYQLVRRASESVCVLERG